jgi:3-phosphoshikimate 1-carboxyvinyltransferase
MSDYLAFPPATGVRGTVAAPPSKSATNRALVLATLSDSAVAIVNPLESEDTRALSRCLAAMGARFETVPAGLRVGGSLAGPRDREITLDAGESGTAARFLAAVASATPGRFLLTGAGRLRERPVGELVESLRSAGAAIEYAGAPGHLPLRISGGPLRSGRIAVDASRSSQFLSALPSSPLPRFRAGSRWFPPPAWPRLPTSKRRSSASRPSATRFRAVWRRRRGFA